jgi:hypothetical protein
VLDSAASWQLLTYPASVRGLLTPPRALISDWRWSRHLHDAVAGAETSLWLDITDQLERNEHIRSAFARVSQRSTALGASIAFGHVCEPHAEDLKDAGGDEASRGSLAARACC